MSKASNKSQWIIGTVMLIGAFGIAIVGMAVADFGENEDRVLVGASANSEAQYTSECGACHIAYPAGFLPERSWKNIMGSLDNHFGENAELDTDTRTIITGYLVANAGKTAPTARHANLCAILWQPMCRFGSLSFHTLNASTMKCRCDT